MRTLAVALLSSEMFGKDRGKFGLLNAEERSVTWRTENVRSLKEFYGTVSGPVSNLSSGQLC